MNFVAMSSSNSWMKFGALPDQDHKLALMVLAKWRTLARPACLFKPIAHAGEKEAWIGLDSSSPDRLAESIWPSALVALSELGIAYYLPLLLLPFYLRLDGHYQEQVLRALLSSDDCWVSKLDKDIRPLCLQLVDRFLAISWSTSVDTIGMFPGLAQGASSEATEVAEGLEALRNRLTGSTSGLGEEMS